jgi:branched-chain amino acid transport system substrate-binding protein
LLLGAPAISTAQTRPPVRIGSIMPYTGVFGYSGVNHTRGMQLFLDSINSEVAGRRIEIVRADDQANTQIGLQQIRKLVEQDQVDLICGSTVGGVVGAEADYFNGKDVFWVDSSGATTDYLKAHGPYNFRTCTTTFQTNAPIAKWMVAHGIKQTVAVASDFAGGRDTIAQFKAAYVPAGGTIAREIYPPINTNDYSAYLADIRNSGAQAVYVFFGTSDSVRFINQFNELGLSARMKLTGAGFSFDTDALQALGKSAVGAVSGLHYCETLQTPANRKFQAAYLKAYNEIGTTHGEYGYTAAQFIVESLSKTNGSADHAALAAAMRPLRVIAPRGPVRFDNDHEPIQNLYIRQVVEVDGKLQNKVIDTIVDAKPLTL